MPACTWRYSAHFSNRARLFLPLKSALLRIPRNLPALLYSIRRPRAIPNTHLTKWRRPANREVTYQSPTQAHE